MWWRGMSFGLMWRLYFWMPRALHQLKTVIALKFMFSSFILPHNLRDDSLP